MKSPRINAGRTYFRSLHTYHAQNSDERLFDLGELVIAEGRNVLSLAASCISMISAYI
jgi:hypothetical protein